MSSVAESPTAKVIRTLQILQSKPGVTANELAARLDVSDRAVRRYVAILREANVPVVQSAGATAATDSGDRSELRRSCSRPARRWDW